jgi:tripartite-type tricarboxylate transporter receptor subunit TctC
VTFGSAGVGSGSHLGGELFKLAARVDLLHVPYRGSSLVTTALMSGEVMTAFTNPSASMPHIKAGRLKLLAVASPERWPLLAQYPTLAESGVPGSEILIWNGVVVREGTPASIVNRLHGELVRAIQQPDVVNHLATDGSRPMVMSVPDFGAFLAQEVAKWSRVTRAAGLNVE